MTDSPKALTLRQLKEHLQTLPDRMLDNEVVIRRHQLSSSIGALPAINITSFHHGFDWEAGQTFFETEVPVRAASDAFRREQAMTRRMADQLGWIWLILRNKDWDAPTKLRLITSHFNRKIVKNRNLS